ncbi:hypothetical protein EVAR_6159_1 [Eumeta japonica]|uniref:Uncharacterized protein n=1 Tax=Eumeta variegata TaxID=151549 RepID=A0A4C1THE7_EUMVA|nr:hypothetical protein EVAR_6159_1 [Eumeta japonica]
MGAPSADAALEPSSREKLIVVHGQNIELVMQGIGTENELYVHHYYPNSCCNEWSASDCAPMEQTLVQSLALYSRSAKRNIDTVRRVKQKIFSNPQHAIRRRIGYLDKNAEFGRPERRRDTSGGGRKKRDVPRRERNIRPATRVVPVNATERGAPDPRAGGSRPRPRHSRRCRSGGRCFITRTTSAASSHVRASLYRRPSCNPAVTSRRPVRSDRDV